MDKSEPGGLEPGSAMQRRQVAPGSRLVDAKIAELRGLAAEIRAHVQSGAAPAPAGKMLIFTGPSGTGKTLAAEVMGRELNLNVMRIDLAQLVGKYVGETEKNLSAVFDSASASHSILFFDEADALFGKRSEVKDSHDRYANAGAEYLLARIRDYNGVVILACNDPACVEGARAVMDFPPDPSPEGSRGSTKNR